MGWLIDDRELVIQNPAIAGFDVGRILSEDFWAPRGGAGLFRPVTALSLALDSSMFGASPLALHRTTLVLHGLAVLAMGLALDGFARGVGPTACLVLLLHPVAADQACWISARSASLMFGLAAVGVVAAHRGRWLVAALCCFVAAHAREDGLLSLLPCWFALPRDSRKRFTAASVIAVLTWLAVRYAVLGRVAPRTASAAGLAAPFDAYVYALRTVLLVETPRLFGDVMPAAGWLRILLPLSVVLWLRAWRNGAKTALGLGWMLIAFAPFAQVVPLAEPVAARFAFPLLPGIVLAAWFALGRWPDARRALPCIAIVLLPLWLAEARVLAHARSTYAQILDTEPGNRRAALMLALAEEDDGDLEAARSRLERLVATDPSYAKAAVNLGRLLYRTKQFTAAERQLSAAATKFARNARAPLTLGRLLYDRKRYMEAAMQFEEALLRNPHEGQAARYLCRALLRIGQYAEARAALDRARRIDPASPALVALEAQLNRR